jgi:hypothetical protein
MHCDDPYALQSLVYKSNTYYTGASAIIAAVWLRHSWHQVPQAKQHAVANLKWLSSLWHRQHLLP